MSQRIHSKRLHKAFRKPWNYRRKVRQQIFCYNRCQLGDLSKYGRKFRQQKRQQINNKSTTNGQQINTNKNVKKGDNVKNGENEKKKATAFDFFQDNGFGFITPYNLDDLNYYLDSFENDSDQIVTASLKIAKDRNKVTWGYAKSILNTWLNANLKSIEQVRAFEKQQLESKKQNYKPFVKQSKEKTPKWLTDSTRETKTPEVDENLEKDREAFIKRLNSKWE